MNEPIPLGFRLFAGFSLSLIILVVFAGCGNQSSSPKPPAQAQKDAESGRQWQAVQVAMSTPMPGEKTCFAGNGSGAVVCKAPGCAQGMVECPGPCARLTKGTWEHVNVAGHDPSELWQKIRVKGGWQSYNQNHVGEVFTVVDGTMVNLGPCKVCAGKTRVECQVCKKTGKQICEICTGKNVVPAAWTPTDDPWFNRQPDIIRLSDGRVLLGKVAANTGDESVVRTREGKILRVKHDQIVTK